MAADKIDAKLKPGQVEVLERDRAVLTFRGLRRQDDGYLPQNPCARMGRELTNTHALEAAKIEVFDRDEL